MGKETSILISTAYLPSIEYFAMLMRADKVIIEKEETYPKQTYRNRCKILTANGPLNLSIPVNKTLGNNTKIKDIEIINYECWFTNHWRAISSAYSNSPFFLYYKDDLEKHFKGNSTSLLDYNTELTNELLSLIGINKSLKYSESFTIPEDLPNDFRYSSSPKKEESTICFKEYIQVFSSKFAFAPNLSIIDLLFNLGPETKEYLRSLK